MIPLNEISTAELGSDCSRLMLEYFQCDVDDWDNYEVSSSSPVLDPRFESKDKEMKMQGEKNEASQSAAFNTEDTKKKVSRPFVLGDDGIDLVTMVKGAAEGVVGIRMLGGIIQGVANEARLVWR